MREGDGGADLTSLQEGRRCVAAFVRRLGPPAPALAS